MYVLPGTRYARGAMGVTYIDHELIQIMRLEISRDEC
jgi:hypothetical protein